MEIMLTGNSGNSILVDGFTILYAMRDDHDEVTQIGFSHSKHVILCRETPGRISELREQAMELERQKFEEMEAKRKAQDVAQEVLEGQKLPHRSETERLNARFVLELERRVRVLEGNDAQDDAWYTRRINAIENRIAKLEGDKTE